MGRTVAFQRRHFEFIAKELRIARDSVAEGPATETIDALACRFANSLGDTNPQFDRARFLTACGAV